MATNADFDALIVRITTATNTLEQDVASINSSTAGIDEKVQEATNAAASSQTSANAAADSLAQTQDLVTELENAVIIQEAPKDGKTYGRNNGSWVEAGGSGAGTVTSVNNLTPNQDGNVTLSAADVGAKVDSYVPTWTEVTGKPTTFAPIVGTTATTALAGNTVIPTNTNQLTNGAGFITAANAPVQSVNGHTGAITLVASDIPNLTTSKITSGLFNPDRLGSNYTVTTGLVLMSNDASTATWTTFPSQPASFIDSGVFPVERLATGTPSSSTFLRGDGTWAGVTAAGPNFAATASQEGAIGGIINRLAGAATNTLTTVVSQLASAGFEYGGMCIVNLQPNSANPGGNIGGEVIVQIIPRKSGAGVTQEVRFVVEYTTGTKVGKKYYTNKYQDAAASWIIIDATV